MTKLDPHFVVDLNKIRSTSNVFQGQNYRITVLTERLIRFEYSQNGIFCDLPTHFANNRYFPEIKIDVNEEEKYLIIGTKYFTMQYTKGKPFNGPVYAPDANLRINLAGSDKQWYPNHPEARNFKSASVSLEDVFIKNIQKGLYSTDGFVTIDDSKGLIIDGEGNIFPRNDGNTDFYLFMYRRDFGYCLNDYFKLTGFPPLLPRYALGVWWNRDRIYDENSVMQMIGLFKKYEIPLSVFLLGEFWHTKDKSNMNLHKTGFTFNTELFPNPSNLISNMHSLDVKLGINIDPSEGINPIESAYPHFANLYKINNNVVIPFNIFDRGYAATFLQTLINPLLALNVDFFWIDYKADIKKLEALNYYVFNNYKNNLNKRPLILSRNSLVASHRYPVLYSGETKVEWKTLNMLPQFNANSANIGLSWWSHDVGGFKDGIEDSDLYLRYIQFSTFSPVFRFSAKRGPYYKREPWLWDIKTYTVVKKYMQLRHKLIPYIYSENYVYHKTGVPIVQPIYYTNPEIYDEPEYKNEYIFGSQFLIAPITKEKNIVMNRSVERIFLPEGIWYDFTTGKKFLGNKRYVTFYKDEDYPVFVKEGAIIPIANLSDNLNNVGNPTDLEINVFPGKYNSYKLYEDDGVSCNYQNGEYLVTSIEFTHKTDNYILTISPTEGKTSVVPQIRNYTIRFRNTRKANIVNVFINGENVADDIETYNEDIDYIVKVKNVDTSKLLTINCSGQNMQIEAVRILNDDINSIISDLKIETNLKEKIAAIIFSNLKTEKKRIQIRKLKKDKLDPRFVNMFLNLLEYITEI